MIRIEVRDSKPRTIEGANDSRSWKFDVQDAVALLPDRKGRIVPTVICFPLGSADPYPPGVYTLHPSTFKVEAFNRLGLLRTLKLERLGDLPAAPALVPSTRSLLDDAEGKPPGDRFRGKYSG